MANKILEDAIQRLRDSHIRITPQRRDVLQYLIEKRNHPTVETIYSDLTKSDASLSLATVYNTLKMFVEQGLVIELANTDDSVHYDYYGHPHFHVICTNCGKIIDVDYPEYAADLAKIDRIAVEKTGIQVTGNHVEVEGICTDCQEKSISEE